MIANQTHAGGSIPVSRPDPSRLSLKLWMAIAATILIALAIVAVRHYKALHNPPPATVVKPAAASSVVALGTLVPGNGVIHLSAPASSGEVTLQSLFVHQNEAVARNQILGTLDSIGRLKAAVSIARADVLQKQAALEKVQAGNSDFQIAAQKATVERLRVEATRQTVDVERYRTLHAQGIISDSEWDTRSVGFNQATAALREAEATLKQFAEIRPVDLSVARADLVSAKASLESTEANVEQGYIRAPEQGQVLHIYTWPGEHIGDSGVLDLGSSKEMFVEAEVYETDIARIRQSQTATITGAALPQPMHGTVSLVERSIGRQQVVNTDPAANTDARIAIVRVKLDPQSLTAAEHFINLQVRVEFQP
jgi:HlyD family secretion protein